jgi:hypothetical protein
LPWLAWLGMLVIIISGMLAKQASDGADKGTKIPALPVEED